MYAQLEKVQFTISSVLRPTSYKIVLDAFQKDAKYNVDLAREAVEWISAVTGESLVSFGFIRCMLIVMFNVIRGSF